MTPAETSASGSPAEPHAEAVRCELQRVLGSSAFRGSHRGRSFLAFVVTTALQGDGESLKERTLAVELFGRKAAADLSDDSIVRVAAREVRKRLAQYYLDEGAGNPIRIELPSGSYVPAFHEVGSRPAAPAAVHGLRFQPRVGVPLVLLAAASVAVAWAWLNSTPNDFDAFWQPAFKQTAPVIVAMAHPLVYHPSTRAKELTDKKDGALALPFQRPVDRELLTASDFVPVVDQYTGFGDTVAAVRLAALFAHRSRSVRVRLASKLEFSDLRDSATILVGSFTNRWTTELTREFRYRFQYNPAGMPCIVDATTGKSRYLLNKSDNGKSNEDYILICRLPHSQTGRLLIMLAGLTQYGTEEAGRILAEPEALASVLRRLPPNWGQRNLELVLHSQVVGDAPTPPELSGWQLW